MKSDGLVHQLIEAAEEFVKPLDGDVLLLDYLTHFLSELLTDVALEERAPLGELVHQLVAMLGGVFHHVVILTVVDHVHMPPSSSVYEGGLPLPKQQLACHCGEGPGAPPDR